MKLEFDTEYQVLSFFNSMIKTLKVDLHIMSHHSPVCVWPTKLDHRQHKQSSFNCPNIVQDKASEGGGNRLAKFISKFDEHKSLTCETRLLSVVFQRFSC